MSQRNVTRLGCLNVTLGWLVGAALMQPSAALAACDGAAPDGAVADVTTEACDDGNLIAGDGCSAACTVEANFTCARPLDFIPGLIREDFATFDALWSIDPNGLSGSNSNNNQAPSIALAGTDAMLYPWVVDIGSTDNDDDY